MSPAGYSSGMLDGGKHHSDRVRVGGPEGRGLLRAPGWREPGQESRLTPRMSLPRVSLWGECCLRDINLSVPNWASRGHQSPASLFLPARIRKDLVQCTRLLFNILKLLTTQGEGNLKRLLHASIFHVSRKKRGFLRQPSFPRQWSSTRGDFVLQGTFAVWRDIFGYHNRGKGLLASRGQRPGCCSTSYKAQGSPTTKNYQAKGQWGWDWVSLTWRTVQFIAKKSLNNLYWSFHDW